MPAFIDHDYDYHSFRLYIHIYVPSDMKKSSVEKSHAKQVLNYSLQMSFISFFVFMAYTPISLHRQQNELKSWVEDPQNFIGRKPVSLWV